MQDKFDDFANFRDFGGVGDGVANDVDALNRAIEQLYKNQIPWETPLYNLRTHPEVFGR